MYKSELMAKRLQSYAELPQQRLLSLHSRHVLSRELMWFSHVASKLVTFQLIKSKFYDSTAHLVS